MKILSQLDLRWCNKKLGASSSTIGRFGCTTTSLSMISDYFSCYIPPDEIASNVHNYIGDLINWKALNFKNFKFEWRGYNRNDVKIKEALKDPNQAVLLNVNNGSHWVLALRPTLVGNSFIVADPLGGQKVDVIKKYKTIDGAAYFLRK